MEAPPKKIPKSLGSLRGWLSDLRSFVVQSQPLRSETCEVHQSERGTQILPSISPAAAAAIIRHPFQVLPGGGDDANSVKVSLNSWLLKDADPTSKIDITGLDEAFTIAPGQRIWLKGDISATYSETPGPITSAIEHGAQWGAGKAFFPLPVEYDTDDGTRLSSGGTPPDNTKQIAFYVPIAYCTTKEADDWNLVDKGFALSIGDDVYIIQQLFDHLMMGGQCIAGGQVAFANVSPYAPQPA